MDSDDRRQRVMVTISDAGAGAGVRQGVPPRGSDVTVLRPIIPSHENQATFHSAFLEGDFEFVSDYNKAV